MFLKAIYYVRFCPFNCFFGTNKYILNRNLKTETCSTIYTFPSYFTSDSTDKNFHKLMEYFTQVFRNIHNYSFFQHNSNCKLAMLIFILTSNRNFYHQLWVSICPCKRGILGQKNLNSIFFLFYKNQFNLLINVFEQHLLNGRHVFSWMLLFESVIYYWKSSTRIDCKKFQKMFKNTAEWLLLKPA